MCDIVPGQLIFAHPRDPAAARLVDEIGSEQVSHVSYVESLAEKAARTDIPPFYPLEAHLLRVPEGQEHWKVGFLQDRYRYLLFEEWDHRRGEGETPPWFRSVFIAPNNVLSLATGASGPAGAALTPTHVAYRDMIGFAEPVREVAPRIVVLDTGVAPTADVGPIEQRNFLADATDSLRAGDDNGHGSVVFSIIRDLLPAAELVVYKVADQRGRASEWDVLAALGATAGADVVNMSVVFGLQGRACPVCGRESHSSRSAVFEYFVDSIASQPDGPTLVAAAGNAGKAELMYPARFGSVVSVSSIKADRHLSTFSNFGATDHAGDEHPNRFVLPGGESGPGVDPEYIAAVPGGTDGYCGTSFAAAYCSAVVAAMRTRLPADQHGRGLLDALRAAADRTVPGYDASRHGNGLLRLTIEPDLVSW